MAERQVRFTEQFFDHLDDLLPSERGTDGTPSVTDFLLFDLPTVRDDLAANFERYTLPTDDPEVRVYVGSGRLVRGFAIYAALEGENHRSLLDHDRPLPARRRLTRSAQRASGRPNGT